MGSSLTCAVGVGVDCESVTCVLAVCAALIGSDGLDLSWNASVGARFGVSLLVSAEGGWCRRTVEPVDEVMPC